MNGSIRRLVEFWKVPRIYLTGISIGVAIGSIVSIYAKNIDLIGGPFVWVGCLIILRRVWSSNPTWSQLFRMSVFWVSLALTVVGNLITYARAK
jgi:hypothetical protein